MDVTAEFRIEFAQTFLQLQYPTLKDDLGEDIFFHAVIVFEHTARETDYKTRNRVRRAGFAELAERIDNEELSDHIEGLLTSIQSSFDSLTIGTTMSEVMFWIQRTAAKR